MYLFMLFALFGFNLFMLNKYHLSFAYFFVSFDVCVYTYMYTYLFIIYLCILFGFFNLCFCFVIFLIELFYVYFIIFIVACTFDMNMYVGKNMYVVSHSLVYMYSVYLDTKVLVYTYTHEHVFRWME